MELKVLELKSPLESHQIVLRSYAPKREVVLKIEQTKYAEID